MTNPPEQHPLTIEVLSAHLDYLLGRVKTTIQEAEALRVRNEYLASRLETCHRLRLRLIAERDTAENRAEVLRVLGLRMFQQQANGQDADAQETIIHLREILALPPLSPTAVEDWDA